MLARKGLLVFSNKICSVVFGFLITYFMARALGPERYGVIGFALAFTGLFAPLGELGFASAHLKRIAENKNIGRCIGTYFSVASALNIFLVIVVLATVYFIKRFGSGFETRTHELAVYVYLASMALKNILLGVTITFDGQLQVAKSQTVEFVSMVTNAVLAVIIALIYPNIVLFALAFLIATFLATLVGLYLFRGYKIEWPTVESIKYYASFAIPVMAVSLTRPLYYHLDTLLVQFFNSSRDVGYYYGAQKLPNYVLLISDSLLFILLAATSRLHEEGNLAGLRELCRKAERYLSLIVNPLVMFSVVFAGSIVKILLGNEYLPSVPIMQLLLIRALFFTITRPSSVLMAGTGRVKIYALVEILSFPVLMAFYFMLIPKSLFGLKMAGLGTKGAALSLVLMAFLSGISIKMIAAKLVAVKLNGQILIHSVVAFFGCLVVYKVSDVFGFNRLVFIIPLFVVCCLIYFCMLWLMRQITREDVGVFSKMLNVRAMKDYFAEELKI